MQANCFLTCDLCHLYTTKKPTTLPRRTIPPMSISKFKFSRLFLRFILLLIAYLFLCNFCLYYVFILFYNLGSSKKFILRQENLGRWENFEFLTFYRNSEPYKGEKKNPVFSWLIFSNKKVHNDQKVIY